MSNQFSSIHIRPRLFVSFLVVLCCLPWTGCRRPLITYNGDGMHPAIPPGSRLVVDFKAYHRARPDRFDIVMFDPPPLAMMEEGALLAFRVIGLPGESVAIRGANVYINGERLVLPSGVVYEPIPPESIPVRGAKLGVDEYFVLGDNALAAFDSRVFGSVTSKRIVGKITRIDPPKESR